MTLDQFCRICYRHVSTMYCDPTSLVQCDHMEVDTSGILSTVSPPTSIVLWDNLAGTFTQMAFQVRRLFVFIQPHAISLSLAVHLVLFSAKLKQ